MVKEKNITLSIVLSFLTFGFYTIYWMSEITRDVDTITNNPEKRSGGMVFLLSIITFSLYPIYWWYENGHLIEKYDEANEIECRSNDVLYLILTIVSRFTLWPLALINYGMIQADINKYAREQENKVVKPTETASEMPAVA